MTLKHARMDVLWQAFQDAVSQNDWGIYEKAHSRAEKELQQLLCDLKGSILCDLKGSNQSYNFGQIDLAIVILGVEPHGK